MLVSVSTIGLLVPDALKPVAVPKVKDAVHA